MRKRVAFRLTPGSKIVIKETGDIKTVTGVATAFQFPEKNGAITKAIRTPLIMCDDHHVYRHIEVLRK
jgi:hypothetical protein